MYILYRYFHGHYSAFRSIPPEVSKLTKLEHLTMKRNHVDRISDQMRNMAALRTLNLRYNNLTHTSIPPEIFENEELTTLGMYGTRGRYKSPTAAPLCTYMYKFYYFDRVLG
jgi:hypothetical protein